MNNEQERFFFFLFSFFFSFSFLFLFLFIFYFIYFFSCNDYLGEPTPILEFLRDALCSGNDEHFNFLLDCLASMVQRPDRKLGVALVFAGPSGAGKSTFGKLIHRIFGQHAFETTSQKHHLFNNQDELVVLILDEVVGDGDKQFEATLKTMITDAVLPVEANKGKDVVELSGARNLVIFSNDKWCVPATFDDSRRFFVPTVSECYVNDHAYFTRLHHYIDQEEGDAQFFTYLKRHRVLEEGWRASAQMPRTDATEEIGAASAAASSFFCERKKKKTFCFEANQYLFLFLKKN